MFTNNAYGSSPPSLVLSGSSQSAATATSATAMANPSTPRQASEVTLADIFREAGLSPPAKSDGASIDGIIQQAENIMLNRTWDDLSEGQRIRLGFLIFKSQIPRLRKQLPSTWATALGNAVFYKDTTEYKTLTSFIQKGGDHCSDHTTGERLWRSFLRSHPEWSDVDDSCFSLFAWKNSYEKWLQPFIRFQATESVVCSCICASNAILYYIMLTTGTLRREAIGQYGINIGRFMRNCFTNDEVFRTIFRHDGGYPDDLIDRLLSTAIPSSRKNKNISFPLLYLRAEMVADTIFQTVSLHIKDCGPILVCNFRTFPTYSDTNVTTFDGDYEQLKGDNDPHHAFLITGVRKTQDGSMGGTVFQVQDSLPGRPFVNIGFDLLLSMEVEFKGIMPKAVFLGTSDENCFDDVHILTSPTSGCTSVTSAEIQELPADAPTFSDLDLIDYSSSDIGQRDNDSSDVDTARSLRSSKPDWLGLDIPEGVDVWT